MSHSLHPSPSTPKKNKHHVPDTPRKRKAPTPNRLQGLRNLKETVETVKLRATRRLKLKFEMAEWQANVIHRIREGYDSIFIAGTGYGKSLIFQALAALEPRQIIIIISPLKALERDQVSEAEAKGLTAVMINENTVCGDLWTRLRHGKDNMYYVSPEMALGGTFLHLWQDSSFRKRVHAVIVDEAHCIVEWGDDFRKEYSGLSRLRDYIGQTVPVVACTATCSTKSFDTIWGSLKFGYRPFWGLDAGCTRNNLTYLIRPLENPKNPILDALNVFPSVIPPKLDPQMIPKCIFYFETLAECSKAVETLRKILPPALRQTVQTFVGLTSEAGKQMIWENFKAGAIRILCATDAAGMGCNVPDIEYVALFCVPRSVSVLAQRWGRAGRDRARVGTCFLFVQPWAFRPKGEPKFTNAGKEKPLERKTHQANRNKLEQELESLINLGFDESLPDCVHRFLSSHFRPETDLHTFKTFTNQNYGSPHRRGTRSLKSNFQLSWTQITLTNGGPVDRCCGFCSSELSTEYTPPNPQDPRLSAYAHEFLFPLQVTETTSAINSSSLTPQHPRSQSVSSNSTKGSNDADSSNDVSSAGVAIALPMSQAPFVPLKHKFTVPESERAKLERRLKEWRNAHRIAKRGQSSLLSSKVDLPDSALKKILDHSGDFLRMTDITPYTLKKIVQLDLASQSDLREISNIITQWRQDAVSMITPIRHGERPKKVQKRGEPRGKRTTNPPIPQPIFEEETPPSPGACESKLPYPPLAGRDPTDVFSDLRQLPAEQAPTTTTLLPLHDTRPYPSSSNLGPQQQMVYYHPLVYPQLLYYPSSPYYSHLPPGYLPTPQYHHPQIGPLPVVACAPPGTDFIPGTGQSTTPSQPPSGFPGFHGST